jgi:histidinol-phosphate aminotransferase
MALSRRRFLGTAGMAGAGALAGSWLSARGREHFLWSAFEPTLTALEHGAIMLASNENPIGPGPAVLDAVRQAFGEDGRAPGRYSNSGRDLIAAIAHTHGVKPENVVLGCGSTQVLRSATHVFTGPDSPLAATIPTYEECAGYARMMSRPVRAVPLDAELRIDLDRLLAASRGAGLVFYCNPNNPTATYVGAHATREFISSVNRESPGTTILIDEAYFDYVTDTDHDTHIPVAVDNPRVLVARTFSKAYGMAGLRMGYAVGHRDAIKQLSDWDGGTGTGSLNLLALHAAIAAVTADPSTLAAERARNQAVREFTAGWFRDRGMTPAPSQANFLFVNIGRPAKGFRDACRTRGVWVGRDFPPFARTHCRISFGTMDEMKAAVAVFGDVLGKRVSSAA